MSGMQYMSGGNKEAKVHPLHPIKKGGGAGVAPPTLTTPPQEPRSILEEHPETDAHRRGRKDCRRLLVARARRAANRFRRVAVGQVEAVDEESGLQAAAD